MLKRLKLDRLREPIETGRLLATLSADVGKAYARWLGHLVGSPQVALRSSAGLAADWFGISRDMLLKLSGEEVEASPRSRDRRFSGETWSRYPAFDALRRGYEAYARAALRLIDETEGVDAEDRRKVRFYTAQFLDAIAPANYPVLNPEVIETTVESRGRNMIGALKNLWDDLDISHGRLNISMSDLGAFEVGENLAVTPGEVIYQNDLIQLIQYTPATDTVAKRPLLVIPPWFNKYYVLDMQPENSLIRYLVDQGQTVFLISWRNPDESMPDKTFDDYMTEGPLKALEVIEAVTGESEVNAVGYCLGGILLACTLAWLEARGRRPIVSGTYLTTLIDYSDVGDVKVFVSEEVIQRLEAMGRQKGYLPGDNVAWGFRLLRAPDLLWSFVINHYLIGRPHAPFDLLYWNEDATNMPLTAHAFFMRNMYIDNRLREPGGIELAGEPIDVTKVRTPAYVLSTRDDHIAPWRTTYETTQLFAGPTRFVLGNSGHIAGVINPPTRVKYGFRASEDTPADPDAWFEKTDEQPGSWWPDWVDWLRGFAGGTVAAREPGSEAYPPLEPAPGAYVKKKIRPDSEARPTRRARTRPARRSGSAAKRKARVATVSKTKATSKVRKTTKGRSSAKARLTSGPAAARKKSASRKTAVRKTARTAGTRKARSKSGNSAGKRN